MFFSSCLIFSGDVFIRAELLPNENDNFAQIVGFKISGIPDLPDAISIASGNNQCTLTHTAFPQPLLIKVLDLYGNATDGSVIGFLSGDSTWKSSLSQLTGAKFFQVRISFVSNTATLLVPTLSALGFAYKL